MSKALGRVTNIFKKNNDVRVEESAYFNLLPDWNYRRAYIEDVSDENDDNEDDASSISSFSTTATMDDNPGPGRILDKHLYQRFGRKIEHLVARVTVSNLRPERIAQFFEERFGGYRIGFGFAGYLDVIIPGITEELASESETGGGTLMAGLNSLVKQTQSDNRFRSAAAIIALIRVSTTDMYLGCFYSAIARKENLFHLDSLHDALEPTDPTRKYFYALCMLARANYTLQDVSFVTEESATALRQYFIQVLDSYRSSEYYDPVEVVGDACLLFAQAVALSKVGGPNDAPKLVMETIYLLILFFLHAIPRVSIREAHSPPEVRKHSRTVLSAVVHWLDVVLYRCSWSSNGLTFYDRRILELAAAIRGSVHAPTGVLFPITAYHTRNHPLVLREALPRRIKATISSDTKNQNPPVIQRLLQTSAQRSQRLIDSLDELQREASTYPTTLYALSPSEEREYFHTAEETILLATLCRAREVPIANIGMTGEFSVARSYHKGDDRKENIGQWRKYRLNCSLRRKWGEYFRSDLDWDWDLASCIKNLYKVRTRPKLQRGAKGEGENSAVVSLDGVQEGSLNIMIGSKPEEHFDKITIAFKAQTGEIVYRTFLPEEAYPPHQAGTTDEPPEDTVM